MPGDLFRPAATVYRRPPHTPCSMHPGPDYADYVSAYNAFMRPALRSAVAAVAPAPGSKGLDAGCGPGDVFELLAVQVTPSGRVVAVDVSRAHLKEAAPRAAHLEAVRVVEHPVDLSAPLSFEAEAFDWVWCADVLWSSSFADPAAVVTEFARVTRPGGTVALFCNNWQRSLLLPGHRHTEFALIEASDTVLRPPLSPRDGVDIEFMAGWLHQADLQEVVVTAHAVAYSWPLPPAARPYVDLVLTEDYVPALEAASLDAEARAHIRGLLTPGHPHYLPDQQHYYCTKTGILACGRVPER